MYDTSTRPGLRSAFSDGDLDTASPARVVVRCFDRLDADLERALQAIEHGDHETTNRELGHAQDLLGEMAAMVDTTVWEHASGLLSIYDYVLRLLAVGSMRKHAALVAEARQLLGEIGDGFRVAATASPAPTADESAEVPAPARPQPVADEAARGFSVLA